MNNVLIFHYSESSVKWTLTGPSIVSAWCLFTTGSFYRKHRKKSVGPTEAGVHLI